ncbi:uncharacterized protein [Sinocyclocheilus grahami]|uniref:uncharacterized protein n=1 Tax=Sinocyclocheilus grahami TaxID=75366 RepID=UPI0007AC56C7|nr:PREDICTED: uncharacterized protein LOC107567462 [Sinocyclocheilus grahami]
MIQNQLQQNEITQGKYFFIIEMGKSHILRKEILGHLQKHRPGSTEVHKVEDCDVILVFCPIVSRAGTDIVAALNELNTCSASKPAILMVFHHSFNPDKILPDSSRNITRRNTLTVDCLFNEDVGLLTCNRNEEALAKIVCHFKPQELKKFSGIIIKAMFAGFIFLVLYKLFPFGWLPYAKGKYYIIEMGKSGNLQKEILGHLQKQRPDLEEVRSVEDCDVILVFCPIVSRAGTDIDAALNKLNTCSGETDPKVASELTLVLLGMSGPEKTAVEQMIFGREESQADTSPAIQRKITVDTRVVDGRQVAVINTPAWFSSGLSTEEIQQKIQSCIRLSSRGTYAFLLVIPAKQSIGEKREIVKKVEMIFGESETENKSQVSKLLEMVEDSEQEL